MDNKKFYHASNIVSLDDFLKSDFAQGSHIYCAFTKNSMDSFIKHNLEKKLVKSISFSDGHTLYPTVPEIELEDAEYN